MPQTTSKMVIEAYAGPDYCKKLGQCQVPFNPETYSREWGFEFSGGEELRGGSLTAVLKGVSEPVFSMTFLVDGTGVGAAALGKSRVDVSGEVWAFLETATVLNRDGSRKAAPPYCRLVWDELNVKCLVTGVKLDAKLLDRAGKPLRMAVTATFRTVFPA